MPGEGGGSAKDANEDVLRAILAKLDEIETVVQSVNTRVVALETGGSMATIDEERPTESKVSHFKPLGDPEFATKRMLDVSMKEALRKHAEMGKEEIIVAFLEDFAAWEQKHFQAADKKLVREVRDLLMAKGVPVKRAAFLQVSQALTEFCDTAEKSRATGSAPPGTAPEAGHAGPWPGRPPDGDNGDSGGSSDHEENLDTPGDRGYHNGRPTGDFSSDTRGMVYIGISPKPAGKSLTVRRYVPRWYN